VANENDPKTVNERMGHTVIGPEATDDQVQEIVDKVDGKDDGLTALPSTDIGNVLAALKAGRVDKLDLFYAFVRDALVRGEGHGTSAEVLEAAEILGTKLLSLARLLAILLPK